MALSQSPVQNVVINSVHRKNELANHEMRNVFGQNYRPIFKGREGGL